MIKQKSHAKFVINFLSMTTIYWNENLVNIINGLQMTKKEIEVFVRHLLSASRRRTIHSQIC